jgi:hypothetical protein
VEDGHGEVKAGTAPIGLVLLLAGVGGLRAASAGSAPPAPAGYVLVPEDDWRQIARPDQDLQRARERFDKRDAHGAAADIRKAEATMRVEAGRAPGDVKQGLEASADELEQLAEKVDSGSVKSNETLDRAFARADHSLARYHYACASEAWTTKAADKTAHGLERAADYTEKAAAWNGEKLRGAGLTLTHSARIVADKLHKGKDVATGEVGRGIEDLGNEIDRVGRKLRATVPKDAGES